MDPEHRPHSDYLGQIYSIRNFGLQKREILNLFQPLPQEDY